MPLKYAFYPCMIYSTKKEGREGRRKERRAGSICSDTHRDTHTYTHSLKSKDVGSLKTKYIIL